MRTSNRPEPQEPGPAANQLRGVFLLAGKAASRGQERLQTGSCGKSPTRGGPGGGEPRLLLLDKEENNTFCQRRRSSTLCQRGRSFAPPGSKSSGWKLRGRNQSGERREELLVIDLCLLQRLSCRCRDGPGWTGPSLGPCPAPWPPLGLEVPLFKVQCVTVGLI